MTDSAVDVVAVAEAILNDDTLQPLPHLCIDGLEPQHQVALVLDALKQQNTPTPTLFSYGNSLARIREQGSHVALQELGWLDFRTELVKRITLVHRVEDKDSGDIEEKPYWPPRALVETIHSQSSYPFPPLQGVVTWPVFSAEGELITAPGYHAASGYWYAPSPDLRSLAIPTRPTHDDIVRAKEIWADVLVDFPFADDTTDRTHAMAIALGIHCRQLIGGHVPMLLLAKHQPRVGSGLLLDVLLEPALGRRPERTSIEQRDDAEMQKSLLAAAREGRPILVLDNLHRELRSAALAMTLTSDFIRGRRLGHSQMLSLPNTMFVIATGNNVRLHAEIAPRAVRIALASQVEHPEERTGFRHPFLRVYVRSRRLELVWASLVLIQAWIDAGRPGPTDTVKPLGDFEEWREVMGGLLGYHGFAGFLGDRDALRTEHAASDVVQLAFLGRWWVSYQTNRQSARDLVPLALGVGMDLGDASDALAVRRLAFRLHDLVGQPVRPLLDDDQLGPLLVVQPGGLLHGNRTWQLLAVEIQDPTRKPPEATQPPSPSSTLAPNGVASSQKRVASALEKQQEATQFEEEATPEIAAFENEPAAGVASGGFLLGSYLSTHCRACKGELSNDAEKQHGLHAYCLEPVPW
jgi:hypothetical protein